MPTIDRDRKDVRFYLYNGFISPISRVALLAGERVFAYSAGGVLLVLVALNKFGYMAVTWLAALVYINEERKRPSYTKDNEGRLLIRFN